MKQIIDCAADDLKELVLRALEAEETHTHLEFACDQLRHAIEHFCKEDYVPAISLAGAAQEVLGRIAKNRTGQDAIDRSLEWHKRVYRLMGHQPEPTRKDVADTLNWIRNTLKHNNEGLDQPVRRCFGRAASDLIDSAVLNLILIGGFTAPSDPVIAAYHAKAPT